MSLIKEQLAVGISIGRKHVAAVMVDRDKANSVLESTVETSEGELFELKGGDKIRELLEAVLLNVNRWIGRRYIPVRLAIPDPSVYTHLMHFDSFPRGRMRRQQLVKWQMEKAFHVGNDALSVAFHTDSNASGGVDVFATALPQNFLLTLTDGFTKWAIEPEAVKMASLYRPGRRNPASSSVSVSIRLEPEYVSVIFWSASGAPYFVRSFWRLGDECNTADELADIAVDVERTLHAFSINNSEKKIEWLSMSVERVDEEQLLRQGFRLLDEECLGELKSDERMTVSDLDAYEYCFKSAIDAARVCKRPA